MVIIKEITGMICVTVIGVCKTELVWARFIEKYWATTMLIQKKHRRGTSKVFALKVLFLRIYALFLANHKR